MKLRTTILSAALALAAAGAALPAAAAQAAEPAFDAASCAVKVVNPSSSRTVRRKVYEYDRRGRIVRVWRAYKAACGRHCAVTRRSGGVNRVVWTRKRQRVRVVRWRAGKRVLVTITARRKFPRTKACSGTPGGPPEEVLGTPVTVRMQPGSQALLDFGTFTRTSALTGAVKGFLPAGQDVNDFELKITSGHLELAETAIFIDDACNGKVSSAIRIGPGSAVDIDTSKSSTAKVTGGAAITSTLNVRVRTTLAMRDDDLGCDKPYLTTGYTDTPLELKLTGTYDAGSMSMASGKQILDLDACIQPGPSQEPCNGYALPLPFLISNQIVATLEFG